MIAGEQDHGRLEALYEISKLFAHFQNGAQPFDPALSVVARTLPLRSAILIETDAGMSKMIVWPSEGQDDAQVSAVKENMQAAYAYLVGAGSAESLVLSEQPGITKLPRPARFEPNPTRRFIVMPLVVAHHPPFGALQVEAATPLDEADLMFVSAIANHLAIALDRERAWRREITRRQYAEENQIRAETTRAVAERRRVVEQTLKEKYEALAAENAQLYEKARRAVQAREQILAVVSHDLKNPLAAIAMTADTLAKVQVPEERRRGLPYAVARIQRAAQKMERLVEDLLDFASIEAGQLALWMQLEDPGPMLHETIASFDGAAQRKRLVVTAEVESNLPKIYCDRDRVLQILSNLVGNATQTVARGGFVKLRLQARERELLFSVSDDGPGICEEDVTHLFERYWRSGEVQYKGTGLGLAIAGGLVSAHGGRIWAESQVGHGATFFFTVPVLVGARPKTTDDLVQNGYPALAGDAAVERRMRRREPPSKRD
jgi:signal transduction histidine kinase